MQLKQFAILFCKTIKQYKGRLLQRCPWIGFIHGLDWIGLDWVEFWRMLRGLDWIGLGPMTVMYKILTAYVFQRNRPRLSHERCFSLHCCFFYFSLLTNRPIDYEQSSTMSWLDGLI